MSRCTQGAFCAHKTNHRTHMLWRESQLRVQPVFFTEETEGLPAQWTEHPTLEELKYGCTRRTKTHMKEDQREAEDQTEDMSRDKIDKDEDTGEDANLEVAQLQGLVAELRDGLQRSMVELCEVRQMDRRLEEKLRAHQTDVDDRIMGLKNSLNTFKEELSAAMLHIQYVSSRQREVIQQVEQLKQPDSKLHRKNSKSDVLTSPEDERLGQSEVSIIQHYSGESPQRSASTQTPPSAKSPVWVQDRNGREDTDSVNENSLRQQAALKLLESERIYVSHLSLLLKANISFNGSEVVAAKDKRPFPSSLRFLIQQHLDLLHTLQDRILRCQWQGIMGDIFMKLTSKESDFLDLYASYLKELPDCLAVITMLESFLESDIMGDDSNPSLHTLLLQPVQRIPEYLLLLQGLLRQTEANHPDYYLLLVCIQQFRTFSSQYQHLLQHNQELLLHNRKEVKRNHASQAKHSKQRLLEQIQSHRFHDWDRDPETKPYEWPSQLQHYSPDVDSRKRKGLGCIPESQVSERSCQHHPPSRPSEFCQVQPGSALADALEEFLLPEDPPGMDGLYEEDRSSLHDVSMFDRCSSASSDSSIDIAFVKCPKSPVTPSHHAMVTNVSTNRDIFGNGYNKVPNRGCVSPDEAVLMRHNHHRPLQASQRKKSKSLNGLQLDSLAMDGGLLSEQRVGVGSHAKLERQGSKGCPTPSRKSHNSPGNRKDVAEKQSEDLHGLLGMDAGMQPWGEEPTWRVGAEETNHTPFSERSRKQDKGGFRSSFKKLFKKKGGEDKKDKAAENQDSEKEVGKNSKFVDVNRGTAV
uniref:rho guanine nucleotide exchange factor 33 n=1 Tax=Doryrhamphus excisus TaxID=161450 RepID=UPI0025AEBF18|nr:rho guanine nucleotide exchange factor 33 [Doryrhamphus excisus]